MRLMPAMPRLRRGSIGRRHLLAAGLMLPAIARAQPAWPRRSVRVIVPYTPGGNADLLGRLVTAALTARLGQSFVVDNKPGAGGTTGAAEAVRAEPDGYTFLLGDIATHAIGPALNPTVAYDPLRDFEAAARLTSVPLLLVVPAGSPHRTLADLVAAGKSGRGVTYASAGIGTPQHLAFARLSAMAGMTAEHVPYRGSAPAVTDLVAGRVDAMIDGTVVPQVRDGSLRALGTTGEQRAAILPEVPTVAEAGLPGYAFASWHGIFAPARTPEAVVAVVNAEVNRLLADAATRERLLGLGIEPRPGTPGAFRALVAEQATAMRELIRASGAKAE
jgi:tripartite-type tricarboxylate transporter receptor subunit TctC